MHKAVVVSFIALTAVLAAQASPAQYASRTSKAYHVKRNAITAPEYGLAKIKSLLAGDAKIGESPDGMDRHGLTKSIFDSLTSEEKFTYIMIHGEDEVQICDVMPEIINEDKKIFAQPPDMFPGQKHWSESQLAYMKGHRTEWIKLLRETINLRHAAGFNIKRSIIELTAIELMPDLIALYKVDRKDQDILSTLMNLMKDGNYEPFRKSTSFSKLYSDTSSWNAYIVSNRANQDLILSRAASFMREVRANGD